MTGMSPIRVAVAGDVRGLLEMLAASMAHEPDFHLSWLSLAFPLSQPTVTETPDVLVAWYHTNLPQVLTELRRFEEEVAPAFQVVWIAPQATKQLASFWNEALRGWGVVFERELPSLSHLWNTVRAEVGRNLANPSRVSTHLSPRQQELLYWIGQGYSNQTIAETMSISEKSVENQINLLYQVLGISKDRRINPRVVAARVAARWSVVHEGEDTPQDMARHS